MPPSSKPKAAETPAGSTGTTGGPDARDAEIERLLTRLADMTQQFYEAKDAAVGAEAELAVALAKLREVENHLHVKTEECGELAARIGVLNGQTANGGERPAIQGAARRLSPILSRTVRLPQ